MLHTDQQHGVSQHWQSMFNTQQHNQPPSTQPHQPLWNNHKPQLHTGKQRQWNHRWDVANFIGIHKPIFKKRVEPEKHSGVWQPFRWKLYMLNYSVYLKIPSIASENLIFLCALLHLSLITFPWALCYQMSRCVCIGSVGHLETRAGRQTYDVIDWYSCPSVRIGFEYVNNL